MPYGAYWPNATTAPPKPEPPLPAAPAEGQTVRIPLTQLSEFLEVHGLRIARRVELTGGGWRVDLVEADGEDASPEEDAEP